jgi:phosphatidylserine/phosphatidylglycerophosphate/cardiolipin synthase-like enzyme
LVIVRRERKHRGNQWLVLLPLCVMACTQEPHVTLLENEEYFATLISQLTQAKQEVVVSMFLFAPGDHENNRASQVREALIESAKRGVRVQVFLDISGDEDFSTEANRGVAKDLRRHGITVHFDSPGRTTHTKLVVIDQRYLLLGSHNFTHSALRHNNEASVLIESPKLARQALAYLQRIGERGTQERAPRAEQRRLPGRQGQ